MRHFITAAVFATLIGFAPSVIAAPAVDAAGAEALKATVDHAIAGYARKAANEGNALISGPVTVTPKGAYYEIRVPDMVAQSNKNKFNIGTVIINASPTNSGAYTTSMALPRTMTMTGPSGQAEFQISLGRQKFSGTFLPVISTFTKIDADYGDIALTHLGGKPLKLAIASIKSTLNLTPDAGNTYSGFNDTIATGLSLNDVSQDKQRQINVSIGSVASKMLYEKYDIAGTQQAAERLNKLYAEQKDGSKAHLQDATKDVMSTLTGMLDGFNNKTEIKDIAIRMTPAPNAPALNDANGQPVKPQPPVTLQIAEVHSGFSARGIQQDKGQMAFNATTSKINFEPLTDDIAGIMPRDINIDLSFDNLPMKDLALFLTRFMDQAAQKTMIDSDQSMKLADRVTQKQELDRKMTESLAVLPVLLNKAGATFTAKNTFIETRDMLATLDGSVKVVEPQNAAAAKSLPLLGSMTLSIRGIDEAMLHLQQKAAEPKADPRIGTLAQALTMVQMFGQPNKAANGQSLRVYKIDFTADGRTLMNGADLSAAAGMMGIK